jgi:cohesin loading factor subunit SCC2
MDQVRQPAVQVVVNGLGQPQVHHHGPPHGNHRRFTRPLLVEEALQYSPMTSAPIFGLGSSLPSAPLPSLSLHCMLTGRPRGIDSISRPDVGRPGSTDFPAYPRSAARKLMQSLDSETRLGLDKSARLRAIHQELLTEHLDGERLPELYVSVKLLLS